MKIYVASSWRNINQPEAVDVLRHEGHDVYDFRNPKEGDGGFHWSEIDPMWQRWTPEEYRVHLLNSPVAQRGFQHDWEAMEWADACLLVMPCGRSAHLEAGYFVGAGKKLAILLSDAEPELMYLMAHHICLDLHDVLDCFSDGEAS